MVSDASPKDVGKRADVSRLALTDIRRAVEVARSIQHPWYRCQSLSSVAEAHSDKVAAASLLSEAFEAAEEQSEINRIVTVASWPLRVSVGLAPDLTKRKLVQFLELAAQEPHTLRRGDALIFLLYAVRDLPELKALVIPPIVDTVTARHGWRIERLIADIALSVQNDHPQYLPRLLAAHSDNKRKRKLLEALGAATAA